MMRRIGSENPLVHTLREHRHQPKSGPTRRKPNGVDCSPTPRSEVPP